MIFRKQLIARIEQVTSSVIQQICSGRLPQISNLLSENYTPVDTQTVEDDDFESEFHEELGQNVDGTERNETRTVANFGTKRGKDRFALMMTVMATAHRLLITNSTITRRSLYYDLKNDRTSNLVPEQRYLDQAVHHVANLLNCSPWELSESFSLEFNQIPAHLPFHFFFFSCTLIFEIWRKWIFNAW